MPISRFAASLHLKPAYAAALALIIIQVGIGILYKAAQTNGKYAFSAPGSVTISEFLKLMLSTGFFYRECMRRRREGVEEDGTLLSDWDDQDDEKMETVEDSENKPYWASTSSNIVKRIGKWKPHSEGMNVKSFARLVREELPVETRFGFAQLALFYVLINNTVFLLYKLADPGSIQLIKSGSTLITAIVSIVLLGTSIVRGQWLAIVLQVCGIVVTQYRPLEGAAYPFSTYMILLFQTSISAVSGVYNQKLCKSVDGSLHVMNMTLYAYGTIVNFVLHLSFRIMKSAEPGFFVGYGSWGAIMVILSNVFIGLAMTAVYRYADAIIKCFATSISTAILLYLSPILFQIDFSFLVLPGTCVVFVATWLYMEATPAKPTSPTGPVLEPTRESSNFFFRLLSAYSATGAFRRVGLLGATTITVLIISWLQVWDGSNGSTGPVPVRPLIESPFQNTMAYVRWNSKHPERMPLIQEGYEPYFHTVHYSMPLAFVEPETTDFANLTHDSWDDAFYAYAGVSNTMQHIIDTDVNNTIDGILFFHFDAWISPLQFGNMDYSRIWFPDSAEPKYLCMTNTTRYGEWWGWGQGFHEQALQSLELVREQAPEYILDLKEWCVGWSDIYFIPRAYFADYIKLSQIFLGPKTFHEVAIPTMLHIIDQTYRRVPMASIIEPIGDCWGDCCASNPLADDIVWKRCGHRLDYLNTEVTNVHYDRLREDATYLGTVMMDEKLPLGLRNGTL